MDGRVKKSLEGVPTKFNKVVQVVRTILAMADSDESVGERANSRNQAKVLFIRLSWFISSNCALVKFSNP